MICPARYACDLHCHTTRSDGNDSPRELIDNAAVAGLSVLGLTDHDIVPPVTLEREDGTSIKCIDYAHERGVTLIPGYEFSCDTFVDDVHICAYGCNWSHPALLEEIAAAERSKIDGYRELCEILTRKGMPLDWARDVLCQKLADGSVKVRKDGEIQRKHIFEAMAAKGYVPNWSAAKIMVRDDPELNVRRRKIDPCAAIRLIHACGGVAILAHPYLIDETVTPEGAGAETRKAYIERLIAAGLDGIEASYAYDKTSYKGTLAPEQIEGEVRAEYEGRLRFISGGSDYHADHKKGGKNTRQIGERGISRDEFAKLAAALGV